MRLIQRLPGSIHIGRNRGRWYCGLCFIIAALTLTSLAAQTRPLQQTWGSQYPGKNWAEDRESRRTWLVFDKTERRPKILGFHSNGRVDDRSEWYGPRRMGGHIHTLQKSFDAQEFPKRSLRHLCQRTTDSSVEHAGGAGHRRRATADGAGETGASYRSIAGTLGCLSFRGCRSRRNESLATCPRQSWTGRVLVLQQLGLQCPGNRVRSIHKIGNWRSISESYCGTTRNAGFPIAGCELFERIRVRASGVSVSNEREGCRQVWTFVLARRQLGRPSNRTHGMGRRKYKAAFQSGPIRRVWNLWRFTVTCGG